MLRRLLKGVALLVAGAFAVALLVLGIGPFLVPTEPAPGVPEPHELATEASEFAEVGYGEGGSAVDVHFLRAGAEHAGGPSPDWILLHGFTFNAWSYEPLLDRLGDGHHAVAYDQPPYGLSGKPDATGLEDHPYTVDAAVEQLLGLLDALGTERAVLVGNSAGGVIALEAAAEAPERIAGVVLINPMVVDRPTLPGWLAGLPQMERLSLFAARWLGDSTALLERSYHDTDAITPRRKARMTLHTGVAGWDRAWGQLIHRSLSEAMAVRRPLADIDTPVRVIIGAEDEIIEPERSRAVAEALPRADAVEIPDCGHVPQEECPAATAEAMQGWLEEALDHER